MTVGSFAEKYGLEMVVAAEPEREITGGYVGDLLSWVMGRATAGDAWMTIMSNINIAAVAALTDVACVILAEGVEADEKVLSVCRDKGINLLSSEKTSFELSGMLADELK